MSTQSTEPRRARHLRALLLAACVAVGLALPTAAAAMPIDNGPTPQTAGAGPIDDPVSPEVRTIVRNTGDTLAIAVAGAALVVAMTSAGYSAVKLSPLSPARRAGSS